MSFSIDDMSAKALGVDGSKVDLSTQSGAQKATTRLMQQSRKYLHSVVKWVRSRTVWSTPSATLIQQQRIHRLQSPVSVIQIWQKRWLSTPRTTFLHRQVSLCLHRRTSLHRVYSPYYSNFSKTVIIICNMKMSRGIMLQGIFHRKRKK